MGNCLFLQQRAIQVMKINGEVLEYTAPIKVCQILSENSGHAISDKISADHLSPDDELLEGHLNYLLPIPPCRIFNTKKLVERSQKAEAGPGAGVVRIKLVISNKELQAMLREGGLTIKDMVCHELQNGQSSTRLHNTGSGAEVKCQGWAPVLETISEVD